MLELRPSCEHCHASLPPDSEEAMICTYECTFCITCVEHLMENVCPNCGGGFEKRPVRPKAQLSNYPASRTHVHKSIDFRAFQILKDKNSSIPPNKR